MVEQNNCENNQQIYGSNKGIVSNVIWKFAERFTAQIVSFIVSLVLARLLVPDDYGVVAIVLVFISIANVFVSSGFGNSLIQKKDADDLDFSSVFYFNIGFSVILYCVLFFMAPVIANFYDNELLILIIRVFSVRIIIASINSVQQAYISKKMAFKRFFLATLFGTVVSGVVGIILAYSGFGVWALVAQYLINTFIDTIVLSFTIKWHPKLMFSWKRLGILFKFGWKILIEGLAQEITAKIRNLIIGKVYTDADLGYYTKAQQFPQLIMTNISSSIGAVLFSAMSNIQDENEKVLFLMRKSVKITSYILFPLLFGMAAVANNMINVLLTEKWIGCVPYLYIFCFSAFVTVGMYPRHQALKAKGRSDVFMIEHMFSRIINLAILFLVYKISVLAIALSGIISSIILWCIIMYTSKKYTNYVYKDQIKDIIGLIIMSLIVFVPTFLFGYFLDWNPIIELVLQIAMGIFIYFILSIIFKPSGFIFVLSFIKKNANKKRYSEEDNV